MSEEKWHNKTKEEIMKGLGTQPEGLSRIEAKERLIKYGFNELRAVKRTSPFRIFLEQFKSYLVIILLAAMGISAVLGEIIDTIVIGIIVVINAIVGFTQEYRAERALEALKELTTPRTIVIRDGKEAELPAREIVPGDIIAIETGDRVPADSRLIEVVGLKVDESSLTGESFAISKGVDVIPESTPLADRGNMIFMGTVSTYGRGKGVVIATGMETEIGKIAEMIQVAERESTPLQVKLANLGKHLGIIILALCGIVFLTGVLRALDLFEMFLIAVGLAVAAIPEGLPAIVTMALALGVQRMVKRNVIIRKLPAVETLGCSTIICSDKTGTLTQNEMTIREIYVNNKIFHVTGVGYKPEGEFYLDGKKVDPKKDEGISLLLRIDSLCNNASLEFEEDNGHWQIIGDTTEGALLVAAAKAGLWKDKLEKEYKRKIEIPFDSDRKRMTTIHSTPEGDHVAYTKGAVEVILELCSHIYENGQMRELTEEKRKEILQINQRMAEKALRVLGMAFRKLPKDMTQFAPEIVEKDLIFVGLSGMMDPPRKEVKDALKLSEMAGIRSIMITGDHKVTAMAVAKELNLMRDGDLVVTGIELDEISDEELERIIDRVAVFARVSPKHKMRIVKVFKKKKQIVAMTGDGVNDAPALKSAEIGVAMGITGTEVTKEASDMVLTDDNFASIVAAIEEGRMIYDNISKVVRYLISTNFGEILTLFIGTLIGLPLPVIAIQILWINLVTDGLPALALGLEPGEPDIMQRKPRDPREEILSKKSLIYAIGVGAIMCIGTLALFVYGLNLFPPDPEFRGSRTIAFTVLMMFQMFSVLNFRSEKNSLFKIGALTNKYLIGAVFSSILLQLAVIYVPFLQGVFGTLPIGLFEWVLIVLVSSSVFIVVEIQKLIVRARS
ncbi:MAG: calcium-transporting P-type ATPase, PMR1-type [Promethearchaeota archaeon]